VCVCVLQEIASISLAPLPRSVFIYYYYTLSNWVSARSLVFGLEFPASVQHDHTILCDEVCIGTPPRPFHLFSSLFATTTAASGLIDKLTRRCVHETHEYVQSGYTYRQRWKEKQCSVCCIRYRCGNKWRKPPSHWVAVKKETLLRRVLNK